MVKLVKVKKLKGRKLNKKTAKKLGVTAVTVAAVSTAVIRPSTVNAEEAYPSKTSSTEELQTVSVYPKTTNLNVLYNMAKNDVGVELTEINPKVSITPTSATSKEYPFYTDVSDTTQLLSVQESKKGNTRVESYATTVFVDVYDKTSKGTAPKVDPKGSLSEDSWDSSIGVNAYSTINWKIVYDSRGAKHYDLQSVSGGWRIADNHLRVSGKVVRYGARGWSSFGSANSQNRTYYLPDSKMTFSYTVPSAWIPVAHNGQDTIGVSQECKITTASGKQYKFTFTNNL